MEAMNNLMQSRLQSEDYLKAEAALAHWKRGDLCLSLEQHEEAIIEYKRCIEAMPFLTKAEFIGLGCVEDRIGYHYDTDHSWVQKVKMLTLREISPHDMLSVCLSKSKNYH